MINVLCFRKTASRPTLVDLGQPKFIGFFLLFLGVMAAGIGYGGYRLGLGQSQVVIRAMTQAVASQQGQIQRAERNARDNMDALALRLGQMQAGMIRIDALGERLVEMAKLDKGEFDFSQPPAEGGPKDPAELESVSVPDFMASLQMLSAQLSDRDQQLQVLENLLMHRKLQEEVLPAGWPIQHGWISSYFGRRTDPFTGRPEFHPGVDFAGKEGSPVDAVAAGIVTWAGSRYGYGNLVEIDHGNGYATLYGHNEKLLVHVGQKVAQGQEIAQMGSTGRSTGPHVHFEVRYYGKAINPVKMVQSRR
ncbi:MAG: M23 family metallopeptidase [Gammaproteobacteria bacterium]